ncbi:MAG: hypothetical protein JO071_15910 [Deltaproteobacteria bacterium]|nr:hypothetical protein [Deltaproteobacteria bacterium]
MALVRKPEKLDTKAFQCRVQPQDLKHWHTLIERANKQRIDLYKSFAEHFPTWLSEVEAELNSMTVRPLRNKVEE